MAQIAIFGGGYVGLVTAACFADLGHDVVVRDVAAERIEALQRGEMPIYEPGLDELVARNRERLTFTTDVAEAVAGAEFLYVAVGTPPTYSGDADLSAVWTVVDELPPETADAVVVMKSTVPVGTGEKVRHALQARGLDHLGYASNPEFTAEGTAVRDFMHPDRIVIGSARDEDGDRVAALHRGIEAPVVRCDVNSAEMIKLAANAFLMTRISFVNEIANVCELVGADVVEVAHGVGLDHRLGPHFLRAGIGYGGSCFPKDSLALKQLAANSGYHFQLLTAVIEVNELQKRIVIGKLQKHLGSLRGKTVALLGLAFKPNTDDMREAPSLVLASRLLAEGAEVRAWDPIVDAHDLLQGAHFCDTFLEAVTGADAAVIVTEWSQLADLPTAEVRSAMARPLIVDGRNMLDPEQVRAAGFAYEAIGRASSPFGELAEAAEPHAAAEVPRLMEALLLGGGKAERLGDAAQGRPKPLIPLAGHPLAAYTLARLARAGVDRVVIACRQGQEEAFERELGGLGVEIVAVGEPEPLGRGGGFRLAAQQRLESGPVLALNGDELLDVDFAALLAEHERGGGAATLVVAQVRSPFGIVDVEDDGTITGFREAPVLPNWVNAGVYVLGEDALARFPERGDHETTAFPELAAERRLRAYRHEGAWLTVNTPKDLRRAEEFLAASPDWSPVEVRA